MTARIIAALLLILVWTNAPGEEVDPTSHAPFRMSRGPAAFCPERLRYEICFWLFRNAAAGQLTFSPTPQGYEALFEAETTGLIRKIAGHRKETMRSHMELVQTTGRLRPLVFQELSTDDGRSIEKTLRFNYYDNTYTVAVKINNQRVLHKSMMLPSCPFEDLLTFFYNLRMGHYGPVKPGTCLQVCLLMSTRTSFLDMMFLDEKDSRQREDYYYAVAHMEKNLTQAGSSKVSCRFSHDLIPFHGVIENAYYFGDLTVWLTGRDGIDTP